ncbi:hypothetical protein SAMN04488561_2051 [Jiangella alba]|uniref:Uncharacterized protein n=1 Tax=Jiangella alba TaxID=561176 RepID=A0A1H5KG84_9ACTN|nr:hypothetical protein SAMN04488561_2051 [Jiangella alba]
MRGARSAVEPRFWVGSRFAAWRRLRGGPALRGGARAPRWGHRAVDGFLRWGRALRWSRASAWGRGSRRGGPSRWTRVSGRGLRHAGGPPFATVVAGLPCPPLAGHGPSSADPPARRPPPTRWGPRPPRATSAGGALWLKYSGVLGAAVGPAGGCCLRRAAAVDYRFRTAAVVPPAPRCRCRTAAEWPVPSGRRRAAAAEPAVPLPGRPSRAQRPGRASVTPGAGVRTSGGQPGPRIPANRGADPASGDHRRAPASPVAQETRACQRPPACQRPSTLPSLSRK